MMPLSFADIEQDNIIRRIGGSPEVKKHLENLGFVVGGNVKVVNRLGGNIIVNVKEARIAISQESMFAGYGNVFGFIIGLLVVAFGVYMLVRKQREN